MDFVKCTGLWRVASCAQEQQQGKWKEYRGHTKRVWKGDLSLMKQTRTAESGAISRNGSFYVVWIIKTLAMMLVVFSVFLSACGQQAQPKKNQQAQGNTAGQQPQEIAPLKQGTYTLADLPPPKPLSAEYGLQDVSVYDNGDMYAQTPSGATFTIKNERQPVSLTFVPSFIPKDAAKKSDGVTFEVRSGNERLYQKQVLPNDSIPAVTLDLPEATTKDVLQLSFVTAPGPSGNRDYDWALWRDVRIVVGEG
jgi:hypothetical protein